MQIDYIVCPDYIEDKLESRHHVTVREVRQVLLSKPRIRFAEKGHTEGNDVYGGFGQTFGGRYLSVFFHITHLSIYFFSWKQIVELGSILFEPTI